MELLYAKVWPIVVPFALQVQAKKLLIYDAILVAIEAVTTNCKVKCIIRSSKWH